MLSVLVCPLAGSLHGLMFLPVLLSLVGPPSLLQPRRKGWVSFFSAVDERGVDDEPWTTPTHPQQPEGEVSMQSPEPYRPLPSAPAAQSSSPAIFGSASSAQSPPSATVTTHLRSKAEFQAYAPFQ